MSDLTGLSAGLHARENTVPCVGYVSYITLASFVGCSPPVLDPEEGVVSFTPDNARWGLTHTAWLNPEAHRMCVSIELVKTIVLWKDLHKLVVSIHQEGAIGFVESITAQCGSSNDPIITLTSGICGITIKGVVGYQSISGP